jgi:WD40 repeat protein
VSSRDGGLGGLAQVDATSGEMRTVVGESQDGKLPYSVSRDERLMLYGLGRDQNRFEVWAHPAGAKDFQVRNVPSDQRGAQLSPDGERLAYVSSESGTARVYVRSLSGQPADSSTSCPVAVGQEPKWGRDGRELFYVAGVNLMVVDIPRGPACAVGLSSKTLFRLGTAARPSGIAPHRYAVTADGQHFLISTTTKEAVPTPFTVKLNWITGLAK